MLLAGWVSCWLPTLDISTSSGDTINSISSNRTITVYKYIDSNECLCNERRNICDLRCCCDTSCSSDLINQWQKANECKEEFVDSINSFFCDETLLALTPRLREINSSRRKLT